MNFFLTNEKEWSLKFSIANLRLTLFMGIEIIPIGKISHIKEIKLFLRFETIYLPFDEPHIHIIRIAHINIINLPYDI